MQQMKIARFGDNMREVAVTEGDKVSAQIQFGFSVNGYGLGCLVDRVNAVADKEADQFVEAYQEEYELARPMQMRLVFDSPAGPALNASLISLGNRFRLLVNTVDAVEPEQPLPKLPVARVLWKPRPNLQTAATAWILAGGAHHTCYSQALTAEYLEDLAEMAGIEYVLIDENTRTHSFKNELRWNEMFYQLAAKI